MITCPTCGKLHTTTVYSTCYACGGKLPMNTGTVRTPSGMQPDGRTVIPISDER